MPIPLVAFILTPVSSAELQGIPAGTPTWIASTSEMRSTVGAAEAARLNITELTPNGASAADWFVNHFDTVDQHYNEQSHVHGYKRLVLYGVHPSSPTNEFLAEFGFNEVTFESFGLSAVKP